MSLASLIKRLQDIMRKDSGVDGDAQRLAQIVWLIFLKVYDYKEEEAELDDDYVPVIPKGYRWRDWAVGASVKDQMTGPDLLDFVNNKLIPALGGNPITVDVPIDENGNEITDKAKMKFAKGHKQVQKIPFDKTDDRSLLVKDVMGDATNYMKNGYLLRDVVNLFNEVDLEDSGAAHDFNDMYEGLLRGLQNAGYDDSYGYYWTVDFQNKTDDKTLCAITSSSSLNGIPADTSWFPEIGPGVKTTEVVSWDKAGLEIYGVKPQDIDTVKLHIDVYDEAEWDVSNRDDPVDDDFVIYPKGEENATEPKHEIQPTDIVLFDNNACSMVVCGFYSDSFMGYTAKAYYENKTNDRIDIILDKGSINGFECTPEGTTLLEPHSNAYIDIRWQEYAETYAENGNDPTSITKIVMPVFVRKDTGSNTVYIDATYSIDPQARTATPIVNPQ